MNLTRRTCLSFVIVIANLGGSLSFLAVPSNQFAQKIRPKDTRLALSPLTISQELSNVPTHLLDIYSQTLSEYPIATKTVTAAILACLGDAIAQSRSNDGEPEYDQRRGLVFFLFGAFYTGMFQHYWFEYLGDHVGQWGDTLGVWGPERAQIPVDPFVRWDQWWSYFDVVAQIEHPPTAAAIAIAKLGMNQFVVVPFFYMPLFFAVTGAMGNLDLNQSIARGKSLFLPILQRNYFFWLPVQFFQFFLVPHQWQIPFVSVSSLVWTVVLSSIGGSSQPQSAPSTIVSYEEIKQPDSENLVSVVKVDAGLVNELTDDVRLEDVENALLPGPVNEALSNKRVAASLRGGLFVLITSAADDAAIGSVVADMLNGEAGIGVALMTALGVGVGWISSAKPKQVETETSQSPATEMEVEQIEEAEYSRRI